ncbi:hypothetical protein QVD17_20730 [Tagetes erecta]|uniref:Uncharacterized protein n=1 Tax=Tagetes erecta TaxID=13708 RepID=A0AAD8KPP8_TARER|nr:hypothetical protein QVD17_20730 [Tagetes erecta]
MPAGLQKRKAAKRKKKTNKTDKRSTSSTSSHHHRGESDCDQHNSPHQMEDSSSGYESLTTERNQKDAKEKHLKIETHKHGSAEINKGPMVEPGSVADYLSQPFESSPEKGTPKVEDLCFKTPVGDPDSGFKTPLIGDPITPVEPVGKSLVEVASKLKNETKIQEKDDLLVAETRNETESKNNEPAKENEGQNLGSESNMASPKTKQDLLRDSTNGKGQNRVNEPKIPECSERQPLLASAPRPSEKASWKNCCGLFELFSGSTRYYQQNVCSLRTTSADICRRRGGPNICS